MASLMSLRHSAKLKICLVSSSGGHFEQLIKLLPLIEDHSGYVVTEDVDFNLTLGGIPVYHVPAVNRTDNHLIKKLLMNFVRSERILHKEKPDVIISTGALPALPTLLLGKLHGSTIIYIESFAKINSPNKAGKLVYRFADRFYVQWDSMKRYYPDAICEGGIY